MNPEDFIHAYERALANQNWKDVDPLVHADACVTFSSGSVHKGKPQVKAAFERNFASIKEETYAITNVHWVLKGSESAVYLFDFNWSGIINGKPASGAGSGTSVLIKEGNDWKLITEHLGPRAA
jgi:ketosteroid isomerase-like protein